MHKLLHELPPLKQQMQLEPTDWLAAMRPLQRGNVQRQPPLVMVLSHWLQWFRVPRVVQLRMLRPLVQHNRNVIVPAWLQMWPIRVVRLRLLRRLVRLRLLRRLVRLRLLRPPVQHKRNVIVPPWLRMWMLRIVRLRLLRRLVRPTLPVWLQERALRPRMLRQLWRRLRVNRPKRPHCSTKLIE
jgi:hypothetical protein